MLQLVGPYNNGGLTRVVGIVNMTTWVCVVRQWHPNDPQNGVADWWPRALPGRLLLPAHRAEKLKPGTLRYAKLVTAGIGLRPKPHTHFRRFGSTGFVTGDGAPLNRYIGLTADLPVVSGVGVTRLKDAAGARHVAVPFGDCGRTAALASDSFFGKLGGLFVAPADLTRERMYAWSPAVIDGQVAPAKVEVCGKLVGEDAWFFREAELWVWRAGAAEPSLICRLDVCDTPSDFAFTPDMSRLFVAYANFTHSVTHPGLHVFVRCGEEYRRDRTIDVDARFVSVSADAATVAVLGSTEGEEVGGPVPVTLSILDLEI